MIAVVGSPAARATDRGVEVGGLAGLISVRAAESGAAVQLVGRIGSDALGDAVVLALARAGVGHAALLRDPARATPLAAATEDWSEGPAGPGDDAGAGSAVPAERAANPAPTLDAADVALGLRYLTEFRVLVIAEPLVASALEAALDAGAFAGARKIAIRAGGAAAAPGQPGSSAAPAADDEFEAPLGDATAFASIIARYAVALDAGADPTDAFRTAVAATGWQPVGDAPER